MDGYSAIAPKKFAAPEFAQLYCLLSWLYREYKKGNQTLACSCALNIVCQDFILHINEDYGLVSFQAKMTKCEPIKTSKSHFPPLCIIKAVQRKNN
jgi:hypothetical protein